MFVRKRQYEDRQNIPYWHFVKVQISLDIFVDMYFL